MSRPIAFDFVGRFFMRSQDAQLVAAKYTSSCPVGAAVLLGKAVNRLILKQVVYEEFNA
jgi:hypothetical protein